MKSRQHNARLLSALFAAMASLSANAELVLTDHPQGDTATTFYDSLTNVVTGNPPPGGNRFSLDAGDIDGQSFTLASAITLDSIYLCYNDQQGTGSFNLLIDEGNDGSIEHTYLVDLTTIGDLQTGGGNGGPFHFVQFDVSSDSIALSAGVHSFSVEGVVDNGEGAFLFAPTFRGDDYEGGQMLSNSGRDLQFAVTANLGPEPSTDPVITSITPLGDDLYELTLEGPPSTVFEFRSATDLVFDPGTLVENLAPGAVPVGTISGPNNSLLITDAAGDATAKMSLTGTRNFVRAQLPAPLLEEDFEGGLPGAWATSDNAAGTAWSVGPPNGTGTEPPAAANGTQCAGTNINANYTNSALASLVTPAFTVPAGGATLSFSQYIDTEAATGGQDFGSIRLLNAADDSPLAGGEVATDLQGISEQWTSESLPLPAAANGLELKLEFLFESDGDGLNFAGFYIDGVVVMPN